MAHSIGQYTIGLEPGVGILAQAAVGSRLEGEGPWGKCFDVINPDPYFGQKTWEQAEGHMQELAATTAIQKSGHTPADMNAIFAGDLLNQCVGSSYGLRSLGIPFMGVYGACSTMAESLIAASVFVDSGAVTKAVACTSSHFCSAERQYRLPLDYGGQRTPTAQLTATASGAVVVGRCKEGTPLRVAAFTIGTIEDLGVSDANNMGAAMAPAAAKTISRFFSDTNKKPADYDAIVTGDLGLVGSKLLLTLLSNQNLHIANQHQDCGVLLYDIEKQDAHAGASGCGCSASMLCSHFLPKLEKGDMKRMLFIATGALLSPTVVQQGESIACIAHLVELYSEK